ncbi:hypothetical protein CCDG5_0625 [[Clostridium] cellulosi]|uniref:ParB/Sulfiredoxin domain-containing protein n=1 Tax=[Clostridium] cellulosi TaxID=29343 RepID=A0A078KRH2_9FIRM|nr:hypothetical protein CCDG5_0625 [[Clostridium] cellulosi]
MKHLVRYLRSGRRIKQSDIFSLDDTIEFLFNSYHGYPNNDEKQRQFMIDKYKNELAVIYRYNIRRIRRTLRKSDEYYEKYFETGIGNDYYNLIWSVRKLKSIISASNIKPIKMETDKLINLVNLSGITKNGLRRAKHNKRPIIVAEFPYLNQRYLVVDGNHRLYYRAKRGDRLIDCYLLSPQQHKKAMVNDLFRYIFDLNAELGNVLHRKIL